MSVTADPRLLARFDVGAGRWRIAEGSYRVALGKSAADYVSTGDATLSSRLFGN
jgi:beta-glucosidase